MASPTASGELGPIPLGPAVRPAVAPQDGPYEPTIESLQNWRTPEWFRNAKLGIFIHWGPYAVPAHASEWYPRKMYQEYRTSPKGVVSDKKEPVFTHHREAWGDQKEFGYKDFIPSFQAESWNPAAWVELFKKAGARYVVPVAEHHDGFAMYDSSLTPWNSVDRGPMRDCLGELAAACREADMRFGVSSHYAFNWRYYTYEDRFDTVDPKNAELYGRRHAPDAPADEAFLKLWSARTTEIIDKYQPEVLWFDFGFNYPEFDDARKKVAAHYYNRGLANGQEVVLQYKEGLHGTPFPPGAGLLDVERGKLADIRELPWQTDTSISTKSWGYIEGDTFKSSDSLIDDLIDIVSKNGCLLLNVGPRADGTIPEAGRRVLLEIGDWLAVNGEAIYATRPWTKFGEGPTEVATGHHTEGKNSAFTSQDIRFTRNGDTLYAIGLAWPTDGHIEIESMGAGAGLLDSGVASVELLGSDQPVSWRQEDGALVVDLPADAPPQPAYALRVTTGT
ncbi:alpha-L-fucosidase [Botrimarina hoheduenensis]|uniref:alpha-L-fucosidase n=1 Tax=Botrimarina hoheduenensis TaxID=2528000 RepID=UPI0018D4B0E9|nr:alpha-L-fucosidase [Botrimarina hoheduenensis]